MKNPMVVAATSSLYTTHMEASGLWGWVGGEGCLLSSKDSLEPESHSSLGNWETLGWPKPL